MGGGGFVPGPRTDGAGLSVRPRPIVASAPGQRRLRALLRAAYRRPAARADVVLPGGRRLLIRAGLDPAAPVANVTAEQWHRLALLSRTATGLSRPAVGPPP